MTITTLALLGVITLVVASALAIVVGYRQAKAHKNGEKLIL